jgi:ADP-ribose pyrophosphatase YjhB (NUDIX family)
MAYTISEGIDEAELEAWLTKALKTYGTYQGASVNYTNADIAPIVMCTVVCGEELLLVKRGYGLADAEGYWSTVNGFIDKIKPVREIARQELQEELSLNIALQNIKVGKSYTLQNPAEKRKYIVFPCLVSLQTKPKIVLDKEHTGYRWIKREILGSYKILDDLPYTVNAALSLV